MDPYYPHSRDSYRKPMEAGYSELSRSDYDYIRRHENDMMRYDAEPRREVSSRSRGGDDYSHNLVSEYRSMHRSSATAHSGLDPLAQQILQKTAVERPELYAKLRKLDVEELNRCALAMATRRDTAVAAPRSVRPRTPSPPPRIVVKTDYGVAPRRQKSPVTPRHRAEPKREAERRVETKRESDRRADAKREPEKKSRTTDEAKSSAAISSKDMQTLAAQVVKMLSSEMKELVKPPAPTKKRSRSRSRERHSSSSKHAKTSASQKSPARRKESDSKVSSSSSSVKKSTDKPEAKTSSSKTTDSKPEATKAKEPATKSTAAPTKSSTTAAAKPTTTASAKKPANTKIPAKTPKTKTCAICKETFENDYSKHQLLKSHKVAQERMRFHCSSCGVYSKNVDEYKKHVNTTTHQTNFANFLTSDKLKCADGPVRPPPAYHPDCAIGINYVITRHFCNVCSLYVDGGDAAVKFHCRSKLHHANFTMCMTLDDQGKALESRMSNYAVKPTDAKTAEQSDTKQTTVDDDKQQAASLDDTVFLVTSEVAGDEVTDTPAAEGKQPVEEFVVTSEVSGDVGSPNPAVDVSTAVAVAAVAADMVDQVTAGATVAEEPMEVDPAAPDSAGETKSVVELSAPEPAEEAKSTVELAARESIQVGVVSVKVEQAEVAADTTDATTAD